MTMNRVLVALAFSLAVGGFSLSFGGTPASQPSTRPAAASQGAAVESVEFDGQKLVLASQAKNARESLKEFIPPGENLDTWTKLASIHTYRDQGDPAAFAENMVK